MVFGDAAYKCGCCIDDADKEMYDCIDTIMKQVKHSWV